MKYLSAVAVASGILAFSVAASAQSRGPYYQQQRDDPYYRNGPDDRNYPNRGGGDNRYPQQGGYGNDRYGYGGNQGSLIARVLGDLDRAASNARLDRHESKHFDEVARKLQEFEERRAQGKFDTGKLDKAIQNLEHLADADRVSGRDRDMLARDLQDLRQFRSMGGRYSNYGDRDYRDNRYNQNRRYDPNWR